MIYLLSLCSLLRENERGMMIYTKWMYHTTGWLSLENNYAIHNIFPVMLVFFDICTLCMLTLFSFLKETLWRIHSEMHSFSIHKVWKTDKQTDTRANGRIDIFLTEMQTDIVCEHQVYFRNFLYILLPGRKN